jgi:citrate lyase subunit beta / citryl-CoA lyase
MRARRSCLAVPGSSPKMMAKAATLPADEIFFDLEDSIAPSAKDDARHEIVSGLRAHDYGDRTVGLRINAVATEWAADDLAVVVSGAGRALDCVLVPKVEHAHEVMFVDHMLRMMEARDGLPRIGIEAQIESATGLANVSEIAGASDRLEALVFGPADMSASLGIPGTTAGLPVAGYPGDHWHSVLVEILVAARAHELQAVDGPHLVIRDLEGLREMAGRSRALGYDGKWAVHPGQIEIINEVFTPAQDDYEKAEAILDRYRQATQEEARGVIMFGEEMIDEATAKMAARVAERGRAAGLRAGSSSG